MERMERMDGMDDMEGWKMNIKCDMCGKEFDTANVTLRRATNPATGIERISYKAPCCGFEYSIAMTNPRIRALMAKRAMMQSTQNRSPSKFLAKMIEETTQEIKKAMDELNQKDKPRQ